MQAGNVGNPLTAIANKLQMKPMTAEDLRNHITGTYDGLRIGMAVIALLLPLGLGIGGYYGYGLPLQGSMSAYYHNPMRNVFVGVLWAIGVFLYLYKGYSYAENIFLNIAGVSAILVAMFPMEWECGTECKMITPHGIFAVAFFFFIALVCGFRATDTLCLIKDDTLRRRYRYAYRGAGIAMFLAPFIVYGLAVGLQYRETQNYAVFLVEAVAIWIFAIYWIVKSLEISSTNAEDRTLDRQVEMQPDGLYEKNSAKDAGGVST
jgi:hypothetical protein